jgi:hypothetical protein
MSEHDFLNYLRDPSDVRLEPLRGADAESYVSRLREVPRIDRVLKEWEQIFLTTEFTGVTTDGVVLKHLYPLQNENPPIKGAARAARAFLATLDPSARTLVSHPLGSRVWRAWMNPEIYLNRFGLRLDEQSLEIQQASLEIVRASLSDAGYRKVRNIMYLNAFLGRLVEAPQILGEYSYNINLFGEPSDTAPWGWQLYGHHLAINCVFCGTQMIVSPVFLGSEPDSLHQDGEPEIELFRAEEEFAIRFMRSLDEQQRRQAILFDRKRDPDMPLGRVHSADELNLAGAFQDNRVIPLEGLSLADATTDQRELALCIAGAMLEYLPQEPLRAKLEAIAHYLDETSFCWIGPVDDNSAFYFRLQSPVILLELDHHSGVFLNNPEPMRFHVHTIARSPNGNDYGVDILSQLLGTRLTLSVE